MKRWLICILAALGSPWLVAVSVRLSDLVRPGLPGWAGYWPFVALAWTFLPDSRGRLKVALGVLWMVPCLLLSPLSGLGLSFVLMGLLQHALGAPRLAARLACPFLGLLIWWLGLFPALAIGALSLDRDSHLAWVLVMGLALMVASLCDLGWRETSVPRTEERQ